MPITMRSKSHGHERRHQNVNKGSFLMLDLLHSLRLCEVSFTGRALMHKEIVALSSAYILGRSRPERSGRGSHKPSILRMNLVQSEERTMYERGTGARDVDFCLVTIDESLNDDVLQQQLHGTSRRWEELQHMEIELRAQLIARVEIMEMQKNFDAKIKEHAAANAKLSNNYNSRDGQGLSGSRRSA